MNEYKIFSIVNTMQDFGYCIWLVPEEDKWDLPRKGFETHITIYKSLSYFDALRLFLSLSTTQIIVERDAEYNQTSEGGFQALQYPVVYSKLNKVEKPIWWPSDAHISVKYQYNLEITDTHIEKLSESCKFNKLIIMKCDGHFKTWTRLF